MFNKIIIYRFYKICFQQIFKFYNRQLFDVKLVWWTIFASFILSSFSIFFWVHIVEHTSFYLKIERISVDFSKLYSHGYFAWYILILHSVSHNFSCFSLLLSILDLLLGSSAPSVFTHFSMIICPTFFYKWSANSLSILPPILEKTLLVHLIIPIIFNI